LGSQLGVTIRYGKCGKVTFRSTGGMPCHPLPEYVNCLVYLCLLLCIMDRQIVRQKEPSRAALRRICDFDHRR